MNKFKNIRDCILCILILYSGVSLLNLWATSQVPITEQQGKSINLTPRKAFLRGEVEVADDKIVNWRNPKNAIHWKFNCHDEGSYSLSIKHNKCSKEVIVTTICDGQQSQQAILPQKTNTTMTSVHLTQGEHSLALFIADIPKKSKAPAIHSIQLTKIN